MHSDPQPFGPAHYQNEDMPPFIAPRAIYQTSLLVMILMLGCESNQPARTRPTKTVAPKTVGPMNRQPSQSACEQTERDLFEDVTATTGITHRYSSGRHSKLYTILETVGGGVAAFDFDQDDDIDLLFTGGGEFVEQNGRIQRISGITAKLYRNDGNWRFQDVTETAWPSNATDYSHGVSIGDYNRDGWPDVFVSCYGRSQLFKNENGVFCRVDDEANLVIEGWSTAAAWADVDSDGWPDLFVAGYLQWTPDSHQECQSGKQRDVCPPQNYSPAPDRLFRNRGDGTFVEITDHAGIQSTGKGLGAVAADFNQDGHVDIYVANDVTANHLYMGNGDGTFREVGVDAGVGLNEFGIPEGSMGVDVGDYNGDGRADIFTTNFQGEDNSLYIGNRNESWSHTTVISGMGGIGRSLVGFGTNFADFNSDGWPDIYVVNGHVQYHSTGAPLRQPALLLLNREGKRFSDVTHCGGPWFRNTHIGRGSCVADLDNDGDLDLVVVTQDDPVTILQNRGAPSRFVRLQLRGAESDPFAVGALVSVNFNGRVLTQWARSGAGYLSTLDRRLTFPVDEGKALTVKVSWPNGSKESFNAIAGQTTNIVQGKGQASADGD